MARYAPRLDMEGCFSPDPQMLRSSALALLEAKSQNEDNPLYCAAARRVLNFMYNLWRKERLCDVIIQTSGAKLAAHKVALAAYSDALDEKLKDFGTADVIAINMADFDEHVVQMVLHFIYTVEIDLNMDNIGPLLACAIELGIDIIKHICKEFLWQYTVDTAFVCYFIAEQVGWFDVMDSIYVTLCQNFVHVVQQDDFLRVNLELLLRLLSDDCLVVCSELDVFFAMARWINASREDRLHCASCLLQCVRLQLICPETLACKVEAVDFIFSQLETHMILYEAFKYHALKQSGSKMLNNYCVQKARLFFDDVSKLKDKADIVSAPPCNTQAAPPCTPQTAPPCPSSLPTYSIPQRTSCPPAGPAACPPPCPPACPQPRVADQPPCQPSAATQTPRTPIVNPAPLCRTNAASPYMPTQPCQPLNKAPCPTLCRPQCPPIFRPPCPSQCPPGCSPPCRPCCPLPCPPSCTPVSARSQPCACRQCPPRPHCSPQRPPAQSCGPRHHQLSTRLSHSRVPCLQEPPMTAGCVLGGGVGWREGYGGLDTAWTDVLKRRDRVANGHEPKSEPMQQDTPRMSAQSHRDRMSETAQSNRDRLSETAQLQTLRRSPMKLADRFTQRESIANQQDEIRDDDCLVALGGIDHHTVDCDVPGRTVQRLDPYEDNTWLLISQTKNFTHHHALVKLRGLLYLIGGAIYDHTKPEQLGISTNEVHVFNPLTGAWTQVASMNESRAFLGAAEHDGYIYAVGGEDQQKRRLDSIERYDPGRDEWTTVAYMPGGSRLGPAVASHHGLIYIVGGYNKRELDDNPVLGSVVCYDPETGRFIHKRPLPAPRCHACLVTARGRLYLIGGRTREAAPPFDHSSLADFEVYSEETDSWGFLTMLRTPRHDAGCAAIGSRIYVVGGMTTEDPRCLKTVECYDIERAGWLSVPDMTHAAAGVACCALPLVRSNATPGNGVDQR